MQRTNVKGSDLFMQHLLAYEFADLGSRAVITRVAKGGLEFGAERGKKLAKRPRSGNMNLSYQGGVNDWIALAEDRTLAPENPDLQLYDTRQTDSILQAMIRNGRCIGMSGCLCVQIFSSSLTMASVHCIHLNFCAPWYLRLPRSIRVWRTTLRQVKSSPTFEKGKLIKVCPGTIAHLTAFFVLTAEGL